MSQAQSADSQSLAVQILDGRYQYGDKSVRPARYCEYRHVEYTVHIKAELPDFENNEFHIVRCHEEFKWLHDVLAKNEENAGINIPAAPSKLNDDLLACRVAFSEKIRHLSRDKKKLGQEEFDIMKQSIENERNATLQKAIDEYKEEYKTYLTNIAAHPILRKDSNFRLFLEHEGEIEWWNFYVPQVEVECCQIL